MITYLHISNIKKIKYVILNSRYLRKIKLQHGKTNFPITKLKTLEYYLCLNCLKTKIP